MLLPDVMPASPATTARPVDEHPAARAEVTPAVQTTPPGTAPLALRVARQLAAVPAPLLRPRALVEFAIGEGLAIDAIAHAVGRSRASIARIGRTAPPRIARTEPAPLTPAGLGREPAQDGSRLTAPPDGWHGSARQAPAAFRAWFGASVMVTAAGAPAVLYHATDALDDFEQFDRTMDVGYHAGSLASATHRLITLLQEPVSPDTVVGPRLLPVYVRITRPLRLEDCHTWELWSVVSAIEAVQPIPHALLETMEQWEVFGEREMQFLLSALGYDGVLYENETELGGVSCFVTDPRQLKAAVGNCGTFGVGDPRLDR